MKDNIWNSLSFTRGHKKNTSQWTGKLRASLGQLEERDGRLLEEVILAQMNGGKLYEIDEREYEKLVTHKVRRLDKVVTVSVPQDTNAEDNSAFQKATDVRESIRMQALIASIGAKMGLNIWLPRNDRVAVLEELRDVDPRVLDVLPLNYDETTLKTIEQIDVLWLRGRAIVRAFEVEHTTSIYSGILRMADLLALQPNMDIKLHIVAPLF